MNQTALVQIAKKVYGSHTEWSGVQLQRLKLLAEGILEQEERNYCARCGKRLGEEGHVHTCTPPAARESP